MLGLILTGAALQGASVETSLLLLAYAAGAATSLALALLVGGRVFAAMKRSLGVGEWVRRGLGVAVLVAVAAIALGLDTGFLTQVSTRKHGFARAGLARQVRGAAESCETRKTPSVVMTEARHDDEGKPADRAGRAADRGRHAPTFRRGRMAELAAADRRMGSRARSS